MTIGHTPGNGELEKIDRKTVDGLEGVSNSLAYKVHEVERHLHSAASWFETATTPDGESHVADRIGDGAGAFQIDAGNDDWGSWVQVLGSDDTPARSGGVYYDPHLFLVEDTERAATYFVQFARGASGADAYAAGQYTELVYGASVQKETGIIEVQTGRAPAGSKLWARCKCPGQDTGTMDFYLGIHEYEG
jgi:hypothetical protein